ncbi:uncharacterized protein METZ01_LOCUS478714, partial [marine metagenome]
MPEMQIQYSCSKTKQFRDIRILTKPWT